MTERLVDDASEDDLPAIVAITNDVIARSTAIFSDRPVTLADRADWCRTRGVQGFPVLVARDAGGVSGFASFGPFRTWPGYRTTVEHSVHVRADARGRGIGTALVGAIIERARGLGLHAMVAGVDAANAGSIRMHARLGFVEVGRMPQVARKFDRWLDLVLLQRMIDA